MSVNQAPLQVPNCFLERSLSLEFTLTASIFSLIFYLTAQTKGMARVNLI